MTTTGPGPTAEAIVTQARAARTVGLPVATLRRYVTLGQVPAIQVGAVKRVKLSAVYRFLGMPAA